MKHRDVFEQLRADHRHVLAELPKLEREAGIANRRRNTPTVRGRALPRILERLARQFDTHMAAEDDVLFPLLARVLPETLSRLEPLSLEHQELRGLLESMTRWMQAPASAERDEQIAVQARDFVDLLRIHVRKEEVAVFRLAKRVLGAEQLDEVAARLSRGVAVRTRRMRGPQKGKHS